ncbi:MAG: acyl-CoA dehydrogenase, partial [Pseudonocardiales bacterium]|nr:acyl-CoA dehydrogenase [Pseudonocardiales bacterium]
MDFGLTDEERQTRDWVRNFVQREIQPLEPAALRRERAGQPGVTREEYTALVTKARQSGFWGVQTPEEYGGMGLSAVMAALIEVELGRSFLQFRFGGAADNILFHANEAQKQEYLLPTIEGDRISCFAITEPGAGSDATAIKTSARKDGSDWVIRGEKTFITGGNEADFTMV